jgi:hypothetical protein
MPGTWFLLDWPEIRGSCSQPPGQLLAGTLRLGGPSSKLAGPCVKDRSKNNFRFFDVGRALLPVDGQECPSYFVEVIAVGPLVQFAILVQSLSTS